MTEGERRQRVSGEGLESLGGSLDALRKRLVSNRDRREPMGVEGIADAPLDVAQCDLCADRGWYTPSVDVSHRDFGRMISCVCRTAQVETERVGRLLAYSNLGPLSKMTFANIKEGGLRRDESSRKAFSCALGAAREYAAAPCGWFTLIGPSGTGKTHIAAAIANEAIGRGEVAYFIYVPELLDDLRSGYAPESESQYSEKYAAVVEAPLVVLDGLGAESSTPWAKEKLWQLLNARYVREMPTVVTTSISLGDMDEYIASRLAIGMLGEDTQSVVYTGSVDVALWGRAPLGAKSRLETFDVRGRNARAHERKSLERALLAATRYVEKPEGWLVLMGGTGVGKTHLATSIASERYSAGDDVVFAFMPEMLDDLRSSYGDDREVAFIEKMRRLKDCDLLVMDDYSSVGLSEWAREKVYQVVAVRHARSAPTVITTGEEMMREAGAIASRMRDWNLCELVLIEARDYRARKVG